MTSDTIAKIQSFSDFARGWSFGEGVPFAPSILLKATQLIKTAHVLGFQETDVFPGLNGEVMVTIYLGADYWEFTIEPDETVTFAYERDDETILYEEGLPFEFAISSITGIALRNNLHFFEITRADKVLV
jgi:hypothetical protein